MDFEETVKSGVSASSVWFYFLRGKQNRGVAKCVKCSKVIKCEGSSTSGMKTHLKSLHNITLNKRAASPDNTDQPSTSSSNENPKKTSIVQYFSKATPLEVSLARLAAKDGLSFKTISSSEDIRLGLLARGFTGIPKTHDGVRQKVKSYHKFVVKQYCEEFVKITKELRKISLTFDEWTSNRNRRYMNINIHSTEHTWNLGLRRVFGSMNAENCVSLLEQHLREFNLSLSDDVMTVTTDGPLVMLKVGRLLTATHQVCLAHGMHLAVCSILYAKSSNAELDLESDDAIDDTEDSDDECSEAFSVECEEGLPATLQPQFSAIVKKVRTLVHTFRRSPVKNDMLQKYVVSEIGKELTLIADTKTRWNSMLSMLKRFDQLKGPVQKVLIDLKRQANLNFNEEDFKTVRDIINALEPIQVAVEHLCRENCSLYEADVALQFMLEQLNCQSSNIAIELFDALKERVQERRSEYADLYAFLSNPSVKGSVSNDFGIFFKTPRAALIKQADEILKRLTTVGGMNDTEGAGPVNFREEDVAMDEYSGLTVKEQLEKRVQQSKALASNPVAHTGLAPGSLKIIRNEFSYYESEGLKGKYLTLLHDALGTIRPTSVAPERAFSVAGGFATKIRSSMGDETLSMLCLLKFHFIKQQ